MPFRFSEFVKRGKSGNPYVDADDSNMPRPMSANSYDFNPYQGQHPPAMPVPSRYQNRTSNETGRLGSQFVQEQRLPSHVQNSGQLADFIKHRDQPQSRPLSSSSSQYPQAGDLPIKGLHHSSPGYSALSYGPRYSTQPSRTASKATSNHIVAGLRNRYAAQPISRVLPGTTRSHKYQGFWLARGTMKTEGDMKARQKFWQKSREERPGSSDEKYVKTSGWY